MVGEGSGLLMEGFSISKDGVKMIKSRPTLRTPFHLLTHNLRPPQAGGAGGCGIPVCLSSASSRLPMDVTEVVTGSTNSCNTRRLIPSLQHHGAPQRFGGGRALNTKALQ